MNAVTFLIAYAVVLSWLAPALLTSPRISGLHPRLTVAAWLATVATASIAWVSALAILIVSAARSLFTSASVTLHMMSYRAASEYSSMPLAFVPIG